MRAMLLAFEGNKGRMKSVIAICLPGGKGHLKIPLLMATLCVECLGLIKVWSNCLDKVLDKHRVCCLPSRQTREELLDCFSAARKFLLLHLCLMPEAPSGEANSCIEGFSRVSAKSMPPVSADANHS